jgi:3-dehydroquinate synthetase
MQISVQLGYLDASVLERITVLIKRLDMSTFIDDINKEELFHAISFDKKIKNDKITMCILNDVGSAVLQDISLEDFFRHCANILEIMK